MNNKFGTVKVVTPDWLTECIKKKSKVDETPFLVVKGTLANSMESFLKPKTPVKDTVDNSKAPLKRDYIKIMAKEDLLLQSLPKAQKVSALDSSSTTE